MFHVYSFFMVSYSFKFYDFLCELVCSVTLVILTRFFGPKVFLNFSFLFCFCKQISFLIPRYGRAEFLVGLLARSSRARPILLRKCNVLDSIHPKNAISCVLRLATPLS